MAVVATSSIATSGDIPAAFSVFLLILSVPSAAAVTVIAVAATSVAVALVDLRLILALLLQVLLPSVGADTTRSSGKNCFYFSWDKVSVQLVLLSGSCCY